MRNKWGPGRNAFLAIASAAGLAAALVVGTVALRAQSATGQTQSAQPPATDEKPAFEVASIKPNHSTDIRTSILMTRGRFTTTGATAKMLIEFAYNVQDARLSGGPSWINSDRFDIEAKEEDATVAQLQKLSRDEAGAQMRLMVQSLLADRFGLKVHRESKELPIYALVVAKNGPKLTPTKLPPVTPGQPPPPLPAPARGGGPLALPPGFRGMSMGRGRFTANGVSLSQLVESLSRQPELAGREVVDQTGLKDSYDFLLEWTPELPTPQFNGPGDSGQGPAAEPPDSSGPSLFTALEEQLGLKLESTKGSVDVIVIDGIQQPSDN